MSAGNTRRRRDVHAGGSSGALNPCYGHIGPRRPWVLAKPTGAVGGVQVPRGVSTTWCMGLGGIVACGHGSRVRGSMGEDSGGCRAQCTRTRE